MVNVTIAIRRLTDARASASHKAVLYSLAAHCGREDEPSAIRASVEQIASGAGASRATVLRVLVDLEAWGLVVRIRTSRREANVYDLTPVLGAAESSHGATTERSHVATTERSQGETSHGETPPSEWSQTDARVVSNPGPSGLTVRPSEISSEISSEREEVDAAPHVVNLEPGMEIPKTLLDDFETHRVNYAATTLDPSKEWIALVAWSLTGDPTRKREPRASYPWSALRATWRNWLVKGENNAARRRENDRRFAGRSLKQPAAPDEFAPWRKGA